MNLYLIVNFQPVCTVARFHYNTCNTTESITTLLNNTYILLILPICMHNIYFYGQCFTPPSPPPPHAHTCIIILLLYVFMIHSLLTVILNMQVPWVEELYAYGNRISQLPHEVCNLKKLRKLALNENLLATLPGEIVHAVQWWRCMYI